MELIIIHWTLAKGDLLPPTHDISAFQAIFVFIFFGLKNRNWLVFTIIQALSQLNMHRRMVAGCSPNMMDGSWMGGFWEYIQ